MNNNIEKKIIQIAKHLAIDVTKGEIVCHY